MNKLRNIMSTTLLICLLFFISKVHYYFFYAENKKNCISGITKGKNAFEGWANMKEMIEESNTFDFEKYIITIFNQVE